MAYTIFGQNKGRMKRTSDVPSKSVDPSERIILQTRKRSLSSIDGYKAQTNALERPSIPQESLADRLDQKIRSVHLLVDFLSSQIAKGESIKIEAV